MTIQERIQHLPKEIQAKILMDSILSEDILTQQRDDEEIIDHLGFFDGKEELSPITDQDKRNRGQIATNTINYHKKKALSIRLSTYDLEIIKKKAFMEGIPYQTYIGSILHKHITTL